MFPRYNIVPGHEHKAFIPYTSIFSDAPVRGRRLKKAASSGPDRVATQTKEDESASQARGDTHAIFMNVSELISNNLHVGSAQAHKPTATADPNEEDVASDPYAYAEPHLVVCGQVERIRDSYVTVKQNPGDSSAKHPLWSLDTIDIPYTHLVYALGSHMPDPLRHETYTKKEGIAWMKVNQKRIDESRDIIIIGGGALGVEMATDIASQCKKRGTSKNITLIHSRQQLLPNFDVRIHEIAHKELLDLDVHVVLGHRLATAEGCPLGSNIRQIANTSMASDVPKDKMDAIASAPRQRVRTTLGLELECDLLLMCTGQHPNSEIMAEFSPGSVNPDSRLVRVLPSLQVMLPSPEEAAPQPFSMVPPCIDCDCFLDKKSEGLHRTVGEGHSMPPHFKNIYAIGDVADAFGALNAGYQAWFMAEVAAENILRDILRVRSTKESDDGPLAPTDTIPLDSFKPGPPLLKLSIGLDKLLVQGAPERDTSVPGEPVRPTITMNAKQSEDMEPTHAWRMALADTSDLHA